MTIKNWFKQKLSGIRGRLIYFFSSARLMSVTLTATLMPIILFLTVTPFFNGTDTACMFSWPIHAHFPHWKPLYLFFIRLVNGFIVQNIDTGFHAPVSIVSLYAIVILQHIFSIAAIVWLAVTIGRTWIWQLMIAFWLAFVSPIFFYSHSVSMESVIPAFILLLTTMTYLIVSGGQASRRQWIFMALCGAAVSLIRYDSFIFLTMLPGVIILDMVFNRQSLKPKAVLLVKSIVLVAVVVVSTQVLVIGLNRLYGVPYDHIAGRAGTYFVVPKGVFESNLDLSPEEISRLAETIKKDTDNPAIKRSIDGYLKSTTPWLEHFEIVFEEVKKEHPDLVKDIEKNMFELRALTEEALTEIFRRYVKIMPERYYAQFLENIRKYLLRNLNEPGFVRSATVMASPQFIDRAPVYEVFENMCVVTQPDRFLSSYMKFEQGFWLRVGMITNYLYIFVALFALWFVGLFSRIPGKLPYELSFSLIVVGLLHIVFMSLAQPMLPRYAVGLSMMVNASFIVFVSLRFGGTKGPALKGNRTP